MDAREYRVKAAKNTTFRAGLYNVVIARCTETLQDKLKSHPNFEAAHQDKITVLTINKAMWTKLNNTSTPSKSVCISPSQLYHRKS